MFLVQCESLIIEGFEKSKMATKFGKINITSPEEQRPTRSWCLNLCLLGCPIYWCRQKSKRTGSHLENPTWLPKSSNFDVKSLVQGIETWSWCLDLCLWGCPIHWCWQISAMGSGHLDKTNMAATKLNFEHKITFSSECNTILVSVPMFLGMSSQKWFLDVTCLSIQYGQSFIFT